MRDAATRLTLGSLMLLAACGFSDNVQQEVHRTVPSSATATVTIRNAVGEISILAWNQSRVDIKATKSARSLADLNGIVIDVAAQDGNVSITTRYRGGTSGGVTYAIAVPAGASVDVRNATGAVDVAGVSGNVTAVTQTGEIAANLGHVAGKRWIDLTATTGRIALTIARDSDARVEAHTTIGTIATVFPSIASMQNNVVGGSAAGTLGAGSATIRLTTTTGTISLKDH